MPHRPKGIFQNLPKPLQAEIKEEIVNLFQQIIYEYLTKHSGTSPEPKSNHLYGIFQKTLKIVDN